MPPGEPDPLLRWCEQRWQALFAVALVFGLLVLKNSCCVHFLKLPGQDRLEGIGAVGETFGWPQICVWRESERYPANPDFAIVANNSWPALFLDVAVAIIAATATWIVFRRIQRDSERWNQFSLATLLALAALAAIICAAANLDATGPGFVIVPR